MSRPLRVEFSGAVYHMTLSQITTRFNLKISGLNTAKEKLSTKVHKDKALKRELQKIRNSIEKRKTEV